MVTSPDVAAALLPALLLGVVAGMRTMIPLAAVGIALLVRGAPVPAGLPAFVQAPVTVGVLVVLALAELIVDKHPSTPNRTALAPFVARLATGALAGAVVAAVSVAPEWSGAVTGAMAAGVAAIVMFRARRRIGQRTGVRDAYVGAGEDVLAIAVAALAAVVLTR